MPDHGKHGQLTPLVRLPRSQITSFIDLNAAVTVLFAILQSLRQ